MENKDGLSACKLAANIGMFILLGLKLWSNRYGVKSASAPIKEGTCTNIRQSCAVSRKIIIVVTYSCILLHKTPPECVCAAALQGCHADDAGAGVLAGNKYLQHSAPVVPPWSGQQAIFFPEMGIPLPSAGLLQLAYPHSCQCHQMSEARCTVHEEKDAMVTLSVGHFSIQSSPA